MRQTCILKLILPLVVVLLLQHTQFSFSCNFNHQSHTHTHTHSSFLYTSLHFFSLPLLWFAWFSHGMCAIPYVWDDKSFLFLLHKMQEFLVFIQFLSHLLCHRYRSYCCCFFRSTHTHTNTSHCVLNICKYLQCHDPKGDMIQMIYPENRKNYLNGWVAQHEALVRICGAYRTNAPKKFRLNSHKSFAELFYKRVLTFGLVWFDSVCFTSVLCVSLCVLASKYLSPSVTLTSSSPRFYCLVMRGVNSVKPSQFNITSVTALSFSIVKTQKKKTRKNEGAKEKRVIK